MRERSLRSEIWVPHPIEEVFRFFADAGNLEEITPPWLRFEILSPQPIHMEVGTLIDYRMRVRGLPVRWRSEITVWEPPYRFVDEQRRGPYKRWHHEHAFEAQDGGTAIRDQVDYSVVGWILEPLIHRVLVGPDVARIFAYRTAAMRRLFGGPCSKATTGPRANCEAW